jgi:hypothetical protein
VALGMYSNQDREFITYALRVLVTGIGDLSTYNANKISGSKTRPRLTYKSIPELPDGILPQFFPKIWYIFVGLGLRLLGIFYGHLGYFISVR